MSIPIAHPVLVFSGDNGVNVIRYESEEHAVNRLRTCVTGWLREDGENPDDYDLSDYESLIAICSEEWDMDVVLTFLGLPGTE